MFLVWNFDFDPKEESPVLARVDSKMRPITGGGDNADYSFGQKFLQLSCF